MGDLARIAPGYISVVVERLPPHAPFVSSSSSSSSSSFVLALWVDCSDYETFKKLPACLEYAGVLCGKISRDSDRGKALYKSGAALARSPGGG